MTHIQHTYIDHALISFIANPREPCLAPEIFSEETGNFNKASA